MKTNIKKDGDKLIVEVRIAKRTRARDPSLIINTKKVLEFLEKNGYDDIKSYSVLKEGLCSTLSAEQITSSEWTFERKATERATRARTTKSTKQSAAKPTQRKRTTRKRTTKSKEDKLLGTKDMGGVQSQAQTDLPGSNKEVPGK
mgnify:FL=1